LDNEAMQKAELQQILEEIEAGRSMGEGIGRAGLEGAPVKDNQRGAANSGLTFGSRKQGQPGAGTGGSGLARRMQSRVELEAEMRQMEFASSDEEDEQVGRVADMGSHSAGEEEEEEEDVEEVLPGEEDSLLSEESDDESLQDKGVFSLRSTSGGI